MRKVLRKARKIKDLSVMDMAKRLGISASFYYKIEQGVRNPALALAREIANLLGYPVEVLFFDEELDDLAKNSQTTTLDVAN